MASTKTRSFVKGLVWEISMAFFSLFFIWWFVVKIMKIEDFNSSLIFTVVLFSVKVCLFFIYERTWKKIKWNKIQKTLKRNLVE